MNDYFGKCKSCPYWDKQDKPKNNKGICQLDESPLFELIVDEDTESCEEVKSLNN